MKYLLLLNIGWLSWLSTSAQVRIAELDTFNIETFQAHLAGDSIFMIYQRKVEQNLKNAVAKKKGAASCMIDRNGRISSLNLSELNDKVILSVMNGSDSINFYYFNKKNTTVLSALSLHRSSQTKKIHDNIIKASGQLLGIVKDQMDLYLVNYLSEQKEFQISRVRNAVLLGMRSFPGTLGIDGVRSPASIFREMGMIPPSAAENRLKIYKRDDVFIISYETSTGVTQTLSLNFVTGESSKRSFPGDPAEYSTLICNDYFFKVVKKKGFHISVFNFEDGRLLKTFSFDKMNPIGKEMSYLRDDETNRILTNRNAWNAMDNVSDPFIAVYPVDSTGFLFKMGTHNVKIRSGFPIVSGLGAVVGILSAVGSIATMSQGRDVDHYFYLTGNIENGFHYYRGNDLTEYKIDTFELTDPPEAKTYLHGSNVSYAFYQYSGSIRIMRFDRK